MTWTARRSGRAPQPMYEDPEFAQPEVRDLIRRIRAVSAGQPSRRPKEETS